MSIASCRLVASVTRSESRCRSYESQTGGGRFVQVAGSGLAAVNLVMGDRVPRGIIKAAV